MPQHPRDRIRGHWASSKRPRGIIIFHMGCPTPMPSSVGRGALNVSSGLLGPSPTRLSPPPIRPVSFLCNRVATGVSMSSVLWVHTNRHHVGAGTRGLPTHINLWFWNLCTWFLKVHYCLFIFFTVFFWSEGGWMRANQKFWSQESPSQRKLYSLKLYILSLNLWRK